jgi:acetyl esterase/lipase
MPRHIFALAAGVALAGAAFAQGTIESDGTVNVAGFPLPPSAYMSEEARKALPRTPADPEAPMYQLLASGRAGEVRKQLPGLMAARVGRLADRYPVKMRTTEIAGVPAVIATPAGQIPPANRKKILLNLPGGGFVMGEAGSTGMVESIPLAAMAKVEVVSLTYRQAPEAMFPAASEDVAKVYRELLKTHRPDDIGIFGCSAGGLLAAQAIAWLDKEKLPLPGAVGIFCASADARWEGDSRVWARPLAGLPPRPPGRQYFTAADLVNPLASSVLAPTILRRFPPTLVISATRAFDLSGAVNTHRELVKAGVDAELHLWDGLGHAFFYDIGLPESREAFAVMTRFFRRHLGLKP